MDLEPHLRARRDAGCKLLVPYVTGGIDARWLETIEAVVAAGADAVEVGIPFSDPVMDGPTIQEASQRALQAGATPTGIINSLGDLEIGVPVVVMTYYNIVFRTGHRRFARLLADNGVCGAIVPDVPLEELPEWSRAADDANVATVLLAAPVTPEDRLARICDRSRGFVYGVSVMGVTGERHAVADSAGLLAKRLKAATDKPVLIGFGVSTPQHAVDLSAESDGVITASVLMRRLLDGGGPDDAGEIVAGMRAALDRP
ncbi:MAG: tryptophan synthase subunit alpha [Actinobacteria bacterium]|nr:tryptophan synthase subunit alpha [Actinomycetota bacterium]